MATLYINLLGRFELHLDAAPLRLRTRKAAALLAYLAVEHHPHSRDSLVELLWPGSDPQRGRGMLRSTLAWVRHAFATDPFIGQHQQVRLNPQLHLRRDLDQIALALNEPAGTLHRQVALLRRAAAAYRGDFLAGFSLPEAPDFEDWMLCQAELWHQRQEAVLRQLTELCADAGDLDGGLEAAARWVSHAPLSEPAHQARIRMHLARGEWAGAHQALERCRATLHTELGLEPAPETLALLQQHQMPAPPRRPLTERMRLPPGAYWQVPLA